MKTTKFIPSQSEKLDLGFMFLCRCRRSKVGGMGFLKLISQAFPRPLPQSPLVFFPLFRSLSFSLALHYLNAWNRLVMFHLNGYTLGFLIHKIKR